MKIAILADIHANFPALEAVAGHVDNWQPDLVFVAGDTVNRGPRSLDCLCFVQERQQTEGWQVIRGNHEDYIICRSRPDDPRSGPRFELYRNSYFTYQQLNEDVSDLLAMPEQLSQDFGKGGELRVVHASMRGIRIGIHRKTRDDVLSELIAPPPAIFATGHTHQPLVRTLNGTLVVNVGSVGLPFDRDTRAGYAQITRQNGQWQAKIVRLPYDKSEARRDFYETGFMEAGGPLSDLILIEMETGVSQLYQWNAQYVDPVRNGEITIAESVRKFLEQPISRLYW
ncbi:MAG: metallophosphatase family protein [Chloroflexi bacterium]|nr:metallophosphatase family protein [Chloroflexota bacterium]